MATSFEDAFKKAEEAKKNEGLKAEKPFDPHSVQSIVPIQEQKRNREARLILAEAGMIPEESVNDIGGIDARDINAQQYRPRANMQADMDALQQPEYVKTVTEEQKKIDGNIEAAHAVELANPWEKYRESREATREEFEQLYSNGQKIPPDVLYNYQVLRDEQLESFKSGAEDEQEKIAAEIESFMARERLVAEAREGSKLLPTMFSSSSERPAKEASKIEKQTEVEIVSSNEGTPKEWRDKLRGLIEGAKEKLGMSERGAKLKEHLEGRSEELTAEAGKYGVKAEELFRSIGKNYDKLGWKSKLAIGAGLGVGTAVFVGVSTPLALLGVGALGAQRIAGMASMYIKLEKHLQDTAKGSSKGILGRQEWYQNLFLGASEEQRKTLALCMAATYTLGVGAATTEAIKQLSESSYGEAVHDFLKHHYPFSPAETASQTPVTEKITAPATAAPEIPQPAVAAAAGESLAPAPTATEQVSAQISAAESANISVEASRGHGYEYMMKRLWEQLQEKHLDPSGYPEGSNIRTLLEANPQSIDKVVHNLATENQFYKSDGTSVRIDLGSKMTFDTDGNILLGENILAPEGVPVTPPYHLEVSSTPAEAPITLAVEPNVSSSDTAVSASEVPVPPIEVSESAVPTPEVPTTHEVITNQFGLEVPSAEPHIYAGQNAELFIYGGSSAEQSRLVQEYLTQNPQKVVFGTDGEHRVPWHLVDGKAVAGPPMRTDGFLGFFSTWMRPPGSDELGEIIT